MKNKNLRNVVLVILIAVGTMSAMAGPIGVAPDRILVKAKEGTAATAVADAVLPFEGQELDEISGTGVKIVRLPAHALSQALLHLQNHEDIEFAEPDRLISADLISNDPYASNEWHLAKIQANTAWNTTTGVGSVIIAIIDTGVDSTHPDLAATIIPGWNFYDNNSNTSDVFGHGTAVAGTAAAIGNNGVGVAGIAWNCRIMPIRISDTNGNAYDSTIAQALTWAADHGARIANISYAASDSLSVSNSAHYFQSKAGVVAVAAGNSGAMDATPDNPYILTVSATDQNDLYPAWSNYGNNVDLAAPGVNILTTTRGGGYGWWSGTSFSAPLVAGTAALVISARPALTGAQASDVIKKTTDDLGTPGWDIHYGTGRLNVSKAVSLALTYDTTPPTIRITSPVSGAKVLNTTPVYVSASDNVAVTKVELYVDGKYVTNSIVSPFTTTWNSKTATSGSHLLQAKAYDAAGNNSLSAGVTVSK